jgi:hypothetical protein
MDKYPCQCSHSSKRERYVYIGVSVVTELNGVYLSASVWPKHYNGQKQPCKCSQSTTRDRNIRVSVARTPKETDIFVCHWKGQKIIRTGMMLWTSKLLWNNSIEQSSFWKSDFFQPMNKFLALRGTRRCITAFIRAATDPTFVIRNGWHGACQWSKYVYR